MDFSEYFYQKIIGEGVSGNKWLNIEVAQNKKEVGDPLFNFENNVPMKTHAKSMQNEQIHAK